ncbi:hypothetical protein [Parasediminibacterium sp. JCM 36343]|uniref:hypothetical protein n=1 Tax=Parasediminibacterium sp. JCM 36343 TaxID=3374279 RepID=UPI00397C5123
MAAIKLGEMDWHKTMVELKHKHLKTEYPAAYEASGGSTMNVKPYNDTTTNGLTVAILDFLKFSKHYANRINCMGISRRINGKMVYTPSSTRKVVADIHSIINGRHISIEVKCKATKDRMSKEQNQERERVESAGGIYYVAEDMASFIHWYKQLIENNNKIQSYGI